MDELVLKRVDLVTVTGPSTQSTVLKLPARDVNALGFPEEGEFLIRNPV